MCCLFASLVLLSPRFVGAVWWIAQPFYWQSVFSAWLWPLLGLIFLPWTTMMFALIAPHGVYGFEWIWIAMAVFADLVSYSTAYGNRDRIPGYRTA